MVWNLALTQLLCYISQFTNEISGNNMTVHRFGVGNYIKKSHKMCSTFWKSVFFQECIGLRNKSLPFILNLKIAAKKRMFWQILHHSKAKFFVYTLMFLDFRVDLIFVLF